MCVHVHVSMVVQSRPVPAHVCELEKGSRENSGKPETKEIDPRRPVARLTKLGCLIRNQRDPISAYVYGDTLRRPLIKTININPSLKTYAT